MSLGASLTSLARSTASTAASLALGCVRGAAHLLTGSAGHEDREARAAAWEPPATDPVPAPEPTPLRDPLATEPTVASRAEAHGGPAGRHADDLYEEAVEDDEPLDPPATADAADDGVLDMATARAVRSEAEVMKRAARPVKEP